jgi:hypothetical protein
MLRGPVQVTRTGAGGANAVSPQREAAICYLRAQIARYRADLAVWRSKARQAGQGLTQSMIVTPLQDLIEDGAALLDRLRCRQGSSAACERQQRQAGPTSSEASEQA